MTVRNLEFLFRPRSVVVVAEPETPNPYAEVAGQELRQLAAEAERTGASGEADVRAMALLAPSLGKHRCGRD